MENTKGYDITSILSNDLYQKILDENIKLHAVEAPYYEKLHPEEFNWFEQGQILQHLKFIRERLSHDAVALDIGCGTGNISLKLLGMEFEVSGVDISEEMLSVLRNKIPASLRNRIKLSCKDIDSFLADCPEQFDLITVSSVLHHIPEYIVSFKRVIRLVKPGGFIYIVHEPTRGVFAPDRFLRKILWQADNLAYLILNFYRIPRVKDRSYKISDYNLYHGFDEEKIVSACRDGGLDILEFTRYASCMRLGISCWIDSILLKSASQFFLIARKNI